MTATYNDYMTMGGHSSAAMDSFAFYSIQSRLGQGAMGAVYLAQDKRLQRPVALKVLNLDLPAEQRAGYARQLEQEARAAARLNHPNIITIYECGFANSLPFIAMELIDGPSLKELLAKGRQFSIDKILKIARQLLKGLAYAHSMGVVHRDIKPANIMFNSSGTLKLTDFGIAHLIAGDWTHTNALSGSPCYMSPEQVRSVPLDGRSDLFSVGTVMYELLTGRLPFAGDNMASIVYQIMFEAPPAPAEINPKVPSWLSDVVMTCLQKDPQQRYQDAEACIKVLKAGGRPPAAGAKPAQPEPAVAPAMQSRSSTRWGRYRQTVLLLGVLAGLGMIAWRGLHPPQEMARGGQAVNRPDTVPAAPLRLPTSQPPPAPVAAQVGPHPDDIRQTVPHQPHKAAPAGKGHGNGSEVSRRTQGAKPASAKLQSHASREEGEAQGKHRKQRELAPAAKQAAEAAREAGKSEEKSDTLQKKGFWQQQADCLLRHECDPAQLKRPRIR